MTYTCDVLQHNSTASPHCDDKADPDDAASILTTSKTDQVLAEDGLVWLADPQGNTLWEDPFDTHGVPYAAWTTPDRLLITTHARQYDHKWGHLGPVFLLNRQSGELVRRLRGSSCAALDNGHFILGLEGYDYFHTWLYDEDGMQQQQWSSYGHYIIGENNDIRVLETDRRIPTRSRVVRLQLDGAIQAGPQLCDGQASAPAILEDQFIAVIDCGVLRIIDINLKEQYATTLLDIDENDSWRFQAELNYIAPELTVTIDERATEPAIENTRHHWLIKLAHDKH